MQKQVPPPPSSQLGNLWLVAASLAMAAAEKGGPQVVTVDDRGNLEAVGALHPNFTDRIHARGYVCTMTKNAKIENIAARIRDAAVAVTKL